VEFEMDIDVTSRVSIHNHEEFEVKTEYNLKEMEKDNSFKMEFYLFIPPSLNINNETYSREFFYRNMQDYLRYKTPVVLLQEVLSPEFVPSPLYQLEKIKKELQEKSSTDLVKMAIDELKLLGCIIRAQIRNYSNEMSLFLRKAKVSDISEDFERLAENLFLILKTFRKSKEDFRGLFPTQKKLIRYFQLTDEFLGNLIEFELAKMAVELRNDFGKEIIDEATLDKLKAHAEEEKRYHQEHGFRLNFEKSPKDQARYLYYMGQYKKAMASVLYLTIKKMKPKTQTTHFIPSIAAFLASVFAFASMVWISSKFAVNTACFIVLASISYVFKDRIKEIVKLIFNPRMLSRFPDYDTLIFTGDDPPVEVGSVREKMQFLEKDKVNSTILSMREETRKRDYIYEELIENIILYQKEISINVDRIVKSHSRSADIVDIMRYNISRYLLRMNEPDEDIYYFDADKNDLCMSRGSRCYFLNLILRYVYHQDKKERSRFERYRIIVKKSGIEEIELVSSL
jgi:hypothetical protein